MDTLNSSAIAWIDYEPISRILLGTFHSSGTHTLRGVPERHYHGLIRTTSPGWHFDTYLKGNYKP